MSIAGLKGEALSNAMMKAETKAKRRVTLSLCGLGMSDETEIDAIPGAQPVHEGAGVREASPKPAASLPAPPLEGISQAQRRRLFAIARKARVPDEAWRAYMWACFGTDSTRALLPPQFEQLCADLENGDVLTWALGQAERNAIQAEGA